MTLFTDHLAAMDAGKRWCYAIPSNAVFYEGQGFVPSMVAEDTAGHAPMLGNGRFAQPWFWGLSRELAEETCDRVNAKMGITKTDQLAILASSIAASSVLSARRNN